MSVSFDFLDSCQSLLDARRVDSHARALQSAVAPHATVVDIGTGLGVFALLACRHGAGKVYAIDSRPMIHLAREVAAANGCADRIEFIEDDPRRVTLPERADVIVCDIRSVLPEFQVPVMIDARRRLLAPGGTLIPRSDRMYAAVVHSPHRHDALVGIWARHPQGLDMEAAHRRSADAWVEQRFAPDELVSEAVCWATIDYRTQDVNDIVGSVESTVTNCVSGHGLCVWFEANVGDGAVFSNRPQPQPSPYTAAFFPWPEAVPLNEGDSVAVLFEGNLAPGGYRWRWQTTVRSRTGDVRIQFEQDTARHAESGETTCALGSAVRPHPSRQENLRVDRHALVAMDRGVTIGTIAQDLLDTFPRRFGGRGEALTYVGSLSQRYG